MNLTTYLLILSLLTSAFDFQGLKISYNQSSIYLPAQVFSSSQDSSVVTIIFLTLHNVLSLPAAKTIQNNSGRHLSPNTSVISATVKPRPPDVFNKPVKIVLRNTKVSVASEI